MAQGFAVIVDRMSRTEEALTGSALVFHREGFCQVDDGDLFLLRKVSAC